MAALVGLGLVPGLAPATAPWIRPAAPAPERLPSLLRYGVMLPWSGAAALWPLLWPHGPDTGGRR